MTSGCQWVKAFPSKFCDKTMKIARKTKKLAQDYPRRIVRSLKVGLAVSLVSLFYYFDPLYDGFEQEGVLWDVLTVVLVFEFYVDNLNFFRFVIYFIKDGNQVMVSSGTVIHGKRTSKSETLLRTVLTKLKLLTTTLTVKSSRALREMASTFLNMVRTSSANTHIESSKKAAEDLKSLLKTNP
ncbi:hypothetical protein F3Y22_tig00110383pilonHSYRG00388 [Hibiscus syriacus]|uniref:Uncharacterized protein n=1 Tax=Hibiscus syriacus TaxID=106335 RepID=A0A6A3ASG6_HIBSY|nr:hypothetical protein F3Y22_tig00110383pilonHSYRG00388 [Hibiscus syriacus]